METFSPYSSGRGPHSFDVLHYDIWIEVFEDTEEISGEVGILFVSTGNELDEISLDLVAMEIDSVWDASGLLGFTQLDSTVVIDLSTPLNTGDSTTVWVGYAGTPSGGSPYWGYHWKWPFLGHEVTFTGGLFPQAGRFLFPCWEDIYDKASIETHLTVDNDRYAVSCGELTGIEILSDRTRYHWMCAEVMPVCAWALVVSDFIAVEDSTYPWIRYYAFADHPELISQYFSKVHLMLDCFQDMFGTYPWDQNLGFPFAPPGGMEHNTIPYSVADEWIVAHELSHMWWGNCVTEWEWTELWLAEGFATYSEAIWKEWEYGYDEYHDWMMNRMVTYLNSGEMHPIVPNEMENGPYTVYFKGASVLHMLRHVLGEDAFWTGLQDYFSGNLYQTVNTEDLITAFEAASSSDLAWFFDTWVYDWGYPDYELSWTTRQSGAEWEVEVTLRQIQTIGPIFIMPVDLLIEGLSKDSLFVMWNDQQNDTETFTVSFEPLNIVLDPGDWLLHSDLLMGINTEELVPRTGISIVPNPSSGYVSLGWFHLDSFTVSLYDLEGRCILKSEISPSNPCLDISDLPSGCYRLLFESPSQETASSALTIINVD